MNRADRRKQAQDNEHKMALMRQRNPDAYFKAKVKAVDSLSRNGITPEDLKKEYHRGYEDECRTITDNIGTIYTCAMLLALNELHGFGAGRLCRVVDRMNEYMVEYITSEEAIQAVYDKLGLRFDKDDPFHPLQFND